MVDLFIRGDTVVTPQGVGAYDIAIAGEKIVGVAASGSFPLPPKARGDRRARQDRHARRDRSARALQVAFAQSRRHAPA